MNKRLDLIFKLGNRYKLNLNYLLEAIIFKDIDILLKNKNIKTYHLNRIKLKKHKLYFLYIYIFTLDKNMMDNKYKSYLRFLIKNNLYYMNWFVETINSIQYTFDIDMEYYERHMWRLNQNSFDFIDNDLSGEFNKNLIKIIKWTLKNVGLNNDIKKILNFVYLYTNTKIKLKEWPQVKALGLKNYKLCIFNFEKRFRKKKFTMCDFNYKCAYIAH